MERFLRTDEESSALFLQRVLLGIVFFPHGAQKLLGWFGGFGFSGTNVHLLVGEAPAQAFWRNASRRCGSSSRAEL